MSASGNSLPLQQQLAQALQSLWPLRQYPGAQDHTAQSDFATRFPRIAVAYSGGLDSSVLLQLAAAFAQQAGVQLFAWQRHCQQISAGLDIHFETRMISLDQSDKGGIEEAARIARYHALGQMCGAHGVHLLLTAHHLDDQAETLLLQILRGSGVAGMSGMDSANGAAALLGNADLLLARPLLDVARSELEQYAAAQTLSFVEDESNSDMRYARNALRQRVMPLLAQFFPGFQQRFARATGHAQAAQRLLISLAAQDLTACLDGQCLSMPALRQLDQDRLDNLLRYWIGLRGLRMPSAAWLAELRAQLLEAKDDAQLCVTHPDCHIRRYRERVFLTPRQPAFDVEAEPLEFVWQGQSRIHFPRFAGSLYFDSGEQGFDPAWLSAQSLSLCLRSGGERLKLASNRPAKSLKYHYQWLDIPAWERPYLPIVFAGKQLLYAAGIGMDCHAQVVPQPAPQPALEAAATCVILRWQAD